jgi:hypothetical protein
MPGCTELLHQEWLGQPVTPRESDQRGIQALLIGLNEGRRPPTSHAGEAESIYFAAVLDGVFVTDDNAAYSFALRRLGVGRVMDSVKILRDAVSMAELSPSDALQIATKIRASGRDLMRCHPVGLDAHYFDQ